VPRLVTVRRPGVKPSRAVSASKQARRSRRPMAKARALTVARGDAAALLTAGDLGLQQKQQKQRPAGVIDGGSARKWTFRQSRLRDQHGAASWMGA
jgi:hypothetical protein